MADQGIVIDQLTRDIWSLVPTIEHFDRMPYVLRPYVMRMPAAGYQSASLNTDEYGFRQLVTENGVVTLDQFGQSPARKGLLCGDSTVFGYGLQDTETLHATLSRHGDDRMLWYSLAVPVANILQNRLLLELFMPEQFDYLTIVVSTLSPVINLLKSYDGSPYPALFGQSTDSEFSSGSPESPPSKRYKLASGITINEPQTAFQSALDDFGKNLRIIAVTLRATTGSRLLVCFRANPVWMDKPFSGEEREMMALFSQKHQSHIGVTSDPDLRPFWMQYVEKIGEITANCGGDFIDLNRVEALNQPEWLFFDHFHPNARGTSVIADQIRSWTAQQRESG